MSGISRAITQKYIALELDPAYKGSTVAAFVGPQGLDLAAFLELYCPHTNEAHFNRLRVGSSTAPDIRKKFSNYVELLATGHIGHLRENNEGCIQDITHCYCLTQSGLDALKAGRKGL